MMIDFHFEIWSSVCYGHDVYYRSHCVVVSSFPRLYRDWNSDCRHVIFDYGYYSRHDDLTNDDDHVVSHSS